ncbi:MAG: carboxymuconolactone decarboxylase family protein, partial [Terriglobia bacterium]
MSAHAEFLRAASKDIELATRIKDDYRTANLTEQDRRMLEFVEKLTLYPWLLTRTDVTLLRGAGFAETTILHIVLGSAHFNYLNRMADGIGIRFEYQTEVPEPNSACSKPESPRVVMTDSDLPESSPTGLAWIEFPEPNAPLAESEGPLNLYRVMSPNTRARDLAREWRNYQMQGTTRLDARLRAQLGLYISGLNHCEYSAYWLRKSLASFGEPLSFCERLAFGKLQDDLPTREQWLFTHARRLTHEPATTKEVHIQQLRDAGLDDQSILQLTMLCSYMNFENRVSLALGIPIESET